MGFSVVSVVEILYFISLRLYCRRYYGGRGSKHPPKNVNTISKLVSKNQRQVWPYVWTHDQNTNRSIKNNNNSMLPAYNRFYRQRIIRVNGWKPTSDAVAYPYLD